MRNNLLSFTPITDRCKGTAGEKFYILDLRSLEKHDKPIQSQINIYTDGSKTEEHTGAGYSIWESNEEIITGKIRLSHNTTVFQAEIIAIKEAVKTLSLHHNCLLYTSPSPRDKRQSRMPSSA